MLGRRIGDQLRWNVPYRVRRLEVKAVHFQPETALAEAA
jgi:transcription elongation GreA/GreB family factor